MKHYLPLLLASCLSVSGALAQQGARDGEWRSYGGDAAHTKYSPLDQINADNVQRLQVAWTWDSVDQALRENNDVIQNRGSFRTYAYEVTPLMVNGVLYTTTSLGQIAAIDPASGETLWSFDPVLYLDGRPAVHGFMTRGLYPTRPPLFLTNGATEDDLIDFTPELRAEALEIFSQYHSGPLYTPPAPGDNIIRPGWSGGANWWGAAFDPETNRLFVPSWAHFSTVNISPPQSPDSDLTIRPQVRELSGPRGLPLFKPPYSQLVAFDMNQGEELWHVPVGDGPTDHPALQGLELAPMGNFEKLGGPLLTKTLLFIGQGFETNRLGVYDKDTGEELWWLQLPARFHAAPITYLADGKQYIVFALGGGPGGEAERLMALALP